MGTTVANYLCYEFVISASYHNYQGCRITSVINGQNQSSRDLGATWASRSPKSGIDFQCPGTATNDLCRDIYDSSNCLGTISLRDCPGASFSWNNFAREDLELSKDFCVNVAAQWSICCVDGFGRYSCTPFSINSIACVIEDQNGNLVIEVLY